MEANMIKGRKYTLIILFLVFNLSLLFAQEIQLNNLNFVNIKEGISKRAIYDIVEDKNGFIWIATHGTGLYRYDGSYYNTYLYDWNNNSSINSNLIYTIFLDSNNQLWVGTDVGLNLYNRDLDKFERIDLSVITKENISIIDLIEDNQGNLLLGTYGKGIIKINKQNFQVSNVELFKEKKADISINTLIKTKKGTIYAGTNKGLKIYKQNKNSFEQAIFKTEVEDYTFDGFIESLEIDNDDNLLIGTQSKGIIKISDYKNISVIENFQISKKKILSILPVGQKIMVGTENDGLLILNRKGEILHRYRESKTNPNAIISNSIWSLYMDKEKRIWIGFYNKGVAVHDRLFNKFGAIERIVNNKESLQSSSVSAIDKDKYGKLWIGLDGGVDIYDLATKKIEHINSSKDSKYKGLENASIQEVFIDSKENVWLGSWSKGIFYLEKGTKKFINYNIESTNNALASRGFVSFSEDSKGRIWIASFIKGLHYYDPLKKEFFQCKSPDFISQNLTNSDVKVVCVDHRDNVWMGTTSGLFKVIEGEKGLFKAIPMWNKMPEKLRNHPSTHNILSIYEDSKNHIWVGTEGAGLLKYDEEKDVFVAYNNIADFNETSINAITEGKDGTLWVSGKSGITNINIEKNKTTNFTIDDGLLGNYFNNGAVYNDENGIIYFGNYQGINYFNPEDLKLNKSEPSLYFSNLKIFNKKVTPLVEGSPLEKVISETNGVVFNHDQSVFTIEYGSISYTRPEKNQYAYFLEGFDVEWNYVGNKQNVTYTNLPSGNYVFKLKSANNDGLWNQKPLQLKIEILPPWWKTKLAYFIYVLLTLLSIYAVSLFLKVRFKQKQAIEFERRRRLEEEKLNKKKLQFFTNISHEFRTPLTLIVNPLTDIINTYKEILPKDVNYKHKVIYKNADRLSRLINELMDFRKLQLNKLLVQAKEIDIVVKLKDIISYFEEEAENRKISLSFDLKENTLKSWIDPGMLEKILFNILSNAFKVTPDNGKINMALKNYSDKYTISISDTGPGMDQKEYKKIFKRFYQIAKMNKSYYGSTGIGLEMVKNFTELNKGEISIESELNKGTTFFVTFPLGKEQYEKNEIQNLSESDQEANFIEEKSSISLKNEELDLVFVKKNYSLLIVEDNEGLRTYLKNELKKSYNIITAENGEKGLELAKIKQPDIIMTDVVMPVVDGLELCKRIKEDIKTSHIPLLMLTSKAMIEDKLEGINSGADAYLNKPFNMGILKSTLKQLITSRQILFDKYNTIEVGAVNQFNEKTTSLDKTFIERVLEYVNEHLSDPNLSVEALASNFSLSRSQFYRKVKALTGLSANKFIRKVRLEKAKSLLESSDYNVSEVMYKVGFSSSSYFAKCFKAEFGYLPVETKSI